MMKKISNKMTIPELCDDICECEAFEEYLIEKIKHNWNPFTKKRDYSDLSETRKKLVRLHQLLAAYQ